MGRNPQTVGHIHPSKAINTGIGLQPLVHEISAELTAKPGAVWQGRDCLLYPVLSYYAPVRRLLPNKACVCDEQLLSAHMHSSLRPQARVNKRTWEMTCITSSSRLVLILPRTWPVVFFLKSAVTHAAECLRRKETKKEIPG